MARRMPASASFVAAVSARPLGCAPAALRARRLTSKIEQEAPDRPAQGPRARPDDRHLAATRSRISRLQDDITVLQAAQVSSRPTSTPSAPSSPGSRTELRQERIRLAKLRARLAESRAALAERLRRDLQGRRAGHRDRDPRVQRLRRPARARGVHAARLRPGRAHHRRACATAKAERRRRPSSARRRSRSAQRRSTAEVDAPGRARSTSVKGTLVDRRNDYSSGARRKAQALAVTRDHRHALEGDLRALEKAQAEVLAAHPGRAGRPGRRPDPPGLRQPDLARQRARSSPGSACAGAACTPASTSPCRPGRRSAPPTRGRVILLGWVGGYGNYTCIDHGGGFAPATATSRASAPRSARRSARARSSATSAAPATASARTCTSRRASTARRRTPELPVAAAAYPRNEGCSPRSTSVRSRCSRSA